jgi:O-antigen/teichoic acid export membrane protein
VVAITLTTLWLLDAPVALMPFGSLALANAVSLTVALAIGQVYRQPRLPDRLRFWDLAREGRWLLAQAIIPSIAAFAVATIVTAIAGAEVLGFAEAARVVAQPILVFATGLTAVLAPRAMRAAMDIDVEAAQYARRLYLGSVGLAGIAYLAVASTAWPGNPMGYIVPAAYSVQGLVAATIAANLITAALYLDTNELLGARKAKELSLASIVLTPISILFAFTSGQIGAFAIPLGRAARNVVQIVWYRVMLRRHYPESNYWSDRQSTESSSATR